MMTSYTRASLSTVMWLSRSSLAARISPPLSAHPRMLPAIISGSEAPTYRCAYSRSMRAPAPISANMTQASVVTRPRAFSRRSGVSPAHARRAALGSVTC